MFKEFTEFPNPEGKDYDLIADDPTVQRPGEINSYFMEILDLVGLLEDGEWVKYGITENEYMHPTKETVDKIRASLGITEDTPTIKM